MSTSTVVIKVGTSSLIDEHTREPRLSGLAALVETIHQLKKRGYGVVLVSSGAIGMGLRVIEVDKKPKHLGKKQALAAIGQGRLMALYDTLFSQFKQPIAQVLLTRQDIADRSRYLNASNCFRELLNYGTVPIVNENDTVSVAEIRFGDNDTLSAITAAMINADWLFLLTDVDCLYTDNPRVNNDAKPILNVDNLDEMMKNVQVSTPGSGLGTGGMSTKITAARLATSAGVQTVITNGQQPSRIVDILTNAPTRPTTFQYTHFHAPPGPKRTLDRKWWIMNGLQTRGAIVVDQGAERALCEREQRVSLFAAGVIAVEGEFAEHESVRILSSVDGRELGRGLVNYCSVDLHRIKGCKSQAIEEILGYCDEECVIHRDNLALATSFTRRPSSENLPA